MTTTPTKNESLPELRGLVTQWRHNAQGCGRRDQHAAGTWRSCARELEAALTREAPTEGVGGEWLLVPKIPTQAMIAAGDEIFAADGKRTRPESVYDAMVHTATPPAPQHHSASEVAIVCNWKDADPFPRFIEAEVNGRSVSLEWRDREDGLKELIVPVRTPSDYPECSGDPASCPENEGHGCCKPNPQHHPDALEDGSLSKSTAKRLDTQLLAQGEDFQSDLRTYGVAFSRDGARIDPSQVFIHQPPHQDRGEVEQRARELLACAYENHGYTDYARHIRSGAVLTNGIVIKAITAALTEAKQQGPGELVGSIDPRHLTLMKGRDGTLSGNVIRLGKSMQPGDTLLYTAPQVEAKRQAGEGE